MSVIGIYKERIKQAVINMFKVNMGIKPRERILIITDYPDSKHWLEYSGEKLSDIVKRSVLTKLVYEIAKETFKDNVVEFTVYPCTGRHGVEPPDYIAKKMKQFDVIIAITSFSLTHTNARVEANKAGARIASMPSFLAEMFEPNGPMAADYSYIDRISRRLVEKLIGKSTIRIVTEAGTDMTLSVEGREWGVDSGILTEKGTFSNLPAGEVYIAPVEGTANGKFVVEPEWYPNLEEIMIFHVKNGEVVKIEGGGKVGDYYRELLGLEPKKEEPIYKARRNIAELGIGTNPNAKRPDNVLEAEKIMGTVHIAIGDNIHIGGKVEADLHQDFVLAKPDLYADGIKLMDKGKLLIE